MNGNGKKVGFFGLIRDSIRVRLESGALRLEEVRRDRLVAEAQTRFMENTVRLVEPDDDDFTIVIGEEDNVRNPTEQLVKDYRDNAQRAIDKFPHAKGYLRQLTRFVIGKGPTFTPTFPKGVDDDGKIAAAIKEWWKTFCKINKWNTKEKEIPWRRWRDGEVFVRLFVQDEAGEMEVEIEDAVRQRLEEIGSGDFDPQDAIETIEFDAGMTLIRFIPPEHVRDPSVTNAISHGIITDKDDVETVLGYVVCSDETKPTDCEVLPARDVIHSKANVDSDSKRGKSILAGMLKNMKRFDDWLTYRIALNLARTAVVLHKQVDGGATAVSSIRDAQQTTTSNPRNSRAAKHLRPNTTVTTNKGVDYKFLNPQLNAQDAQHDGRSILLTLAALSGMPEYMFTGDSSNSNFASHLVSESPALREFEDQQDQITEVYEAVFFAVIKNGRESIDGLTEEAFAQMGLEIVYPPLQTRDELQSTKRNEVLHLNDILSAEGWAAEEGIDWETERPRVEQERQDKQDRMGPLSRIPRPDDDGGGSTGGSTGE